MQENAKVKEFIRAIPKTDLHVHIDGSLRVGTLIELAQKGNINLPSYTPEGLHELVFKDQYANLVEYLRGFDYTTAVMQDLDNIERISYEMALDAIAEGVRYIEPRFAPQLHTSKDRSIEDVCLAVNRGFARAKREHNSTAAVLNGEDVPFEYGIIVCAMRFFVPQSSEYFGKIFEVMASAPQADIHAQASIELARAAIACRDKHGVPIVGFDLAGAENGWPAGDHIQAYAYAHRHFMNLTVHAGEAYGPESIFQAITDLHADRIGHGYYLFDANAVTDKSITDKAQYVEDLSSYIAHRRITIEVCLTSNMQTNPSLTNLSRHPFKDMLEHKLSTTICTDNRLVSNTTTTHEIELAINHFDISPKDLKNMVVYGFKRSFFPGSYKEKREYVRKAIDRYEKLEKDMNPFA